MLGYFKLFVYSKEFFNKLDTAYERVCMANEKDKYWTEMYYTITDYNELNHTPFSSAKIRKELDKVMLEEQAEPNNTTVDIFSP